VKILSPINSALEVNPLVEAGAGELYAGVLEEGWRSKYTNVASPNRREWSVSNMGSYRELAQAVSLAHSLGAKVFLTMNALYTAPQYPRLRQEIEKARETGVDALIVADPGLMLLLRQEGWDGELHVSTGATVFNRAAARLYHEKMGASRLIIPRHHSLEEILGLARSIDFMELECFIFNSGCKNIDGFCTYHHGVNELLHGQGYSLPKKLGLDYAFLRLLRLLPPGMAKTIAGACSGRSDSACLLNWKVEPISMGDWDEARLKKAGEWIRSTFGLWSGLDPCGACAVPDLYDAGIKSLKIVGRENPTSKKIKDVRYLKRLVDLWSAGGITKDGFRGEAVRLYGEIFGAPCREWCYYPGCSVAGG
jgi:collagenase-like PrtC family protease